MGDYKAEKEAFVAGNPGQSVWEVNAISLVGLTSYGLYLTVQPLLKRTHPSVDYVLGVLPLLLGQTVCAAYPVLFNLALGILCFLARTYHTRILAPPSAFGTLNGRPPATPSRPRTKGQWLEESDSDEEPSHLSVPIVSHGSWRTTLDVSPSDSRPQSPFDLVSPTTTTASTVSRSGSPTPPPRRKTPSPSPSHATIDMPNVPSSYLSHRGSNHPGMQPLNVSPRLDIPTGPEAATSKKPFLSVYRAHMMVMTIIAILAVDFEIFPRVQAKCEDFGTSLMDIGVGSFVFSLGLVASRAQSRRDNVRFDSAEFVSSLVSSLRRSLPLLVLGLVRVLMVKGTEYPEHVTEYGVHWNFFFTLGLLPFFGALMEPFRQKGWRWSVMAVSITIGHQLSLSMTSLQSYVLSEARGGLVGMNKEGLVSFPGYLSIYFIGISTGQHILPALRTRVRSSVTSEARRQAELALVLFGYAVAWWVVVLAVLGAGGQVSRRMANLPYVAWTAAFNTSFLLGYLVLEMKLSLSTINADGTKISPGSPSSPPAAVPPLLEAINANGLVIFLAANLLTGLVNVSMKTMYAGPVTALAVLGAYSASVSGVAWAMRAYRVKL